MQASGRTGETTVAGHTDAGVDIGSLIDSRPWSARGKLVLLLVSLAIVFDGLDNQVLGFAAPAILREWGIGKGALAPVLAAGQVGMLIGMTTIGAAGDRHGRKPALVASVATFGIATLAMAAATGTTMLGALRVVAGIGIGGALPNAAALVAEYTPARRRSLAVAASIVCVPLGGVLGGVMAAEILLQFGWRALFAIAGCLPLLAAVVLALALPESARHLFNRRGDSPDVRRALARGGIAVPATAALYDATTTAAIGRTSWSAILARDRRADTLALWLAFAGSSIAVYTGFGWLPTMLAEAGFGLALASTGLTAFNLGGIAGALGGAWAIGVLGSRRVMVPVSLAAVATTCVAVAMPVDAGRPIAMMAMMALLGLFANSTQTMLYALAAHIYPVAMRSSGVGAAAGAGRSGAIASSFLGGAALAAFGTSGFFLLLAAAMAIAALGLILIGRHIPATGLIDS